MKFLFFSVTIYTLVLMNTVRVVPKVTSETNLQNIWLLVVDLCSDKHVHVDAFVILNNLSVWKRKTRSCYYKLRYCIFYELLHGRFLILTSSPCVSSSKLISSIFYFCLVIFINVEENRLGNVIKPRENERCKWMLVLNIKLIQV